MESFTPETIIELILNPNFEGVWNIVRIILMVLTMLLIASFIFLLKKTTFLKWAFFEDTVEFLTYRQYGIRKVKIWQKVLAGLETGLESEYKLSLISADNIMDDTLKRMGYRGENLAERMTNLTPATIPNLENIKEAHQLRNNIVHDPDYRLYLDEAKKTIDIYEEALSSLDAF